MTEKEAQQISEAASVSVEEMRQEKGQKQLIVTGKNVEEEPDKTNWLVKLKDEFQKRGAKTEEEGAAILKKETGIVVKNFTMSNKQAQILYMSLINSKK